MNNSEAYMMNSNQDSNDLIVIVEDDIKLANLVSSFLSKNGFNVNHQTDGIKGIAVVKDLSPDLVILDVMLPGLNGLGVCRELRTFYTGPIVMLTALDDDIDEVTGLEMGADGYLGKPTKPRVLLAHIRAHLRHSQNKPLAINDSTLLINAGTLSLDASKRCVTKDNKEIEFTSAEFDLLWLLAEQKGKIIDRDSLHLKTFKIEYDGLDRNIDIRISRLRKKLGDDTKHPSIIKTVRGKGYLLIS
jgi:two-component system response regulator RstA